MLLLNKVRLINWHFFHDALLKLGEMTLLAGDNGSGKSTIIDAIQYALVADIRKLQFNAAATQNRTNRTLESYCRCKIGATELDYYRQVTLTHVVLEFRRDENPFLAGIMVEANAQGDIKETLWLMEQGKLEDIRFNDAEVMLKPVYFKEQIKDSGGYICSTKREYISQLTLLLKVHRRNLDFNPYLEALIRSVSFSPFTSVDRFVCNYILEERQVDISAMKENLLNYKEAEREALAIEEKIESLARLEKRQLAIDQLTIQIKLQEYLKKRINVEINRLQQAANKRDQAELEREKNNLAERLDYNEQRRKRTEALLDELKLALAKNDSHLLYKKLSDQKNTLNFSLEKEEARCERYRLLKEQCQTMLGRELATSLEEEQTKLEAEQADNLKNRLETERLRDEARRLLSDLRSEEKDLQKGIIRYPESTLSLQQALSAKKIEAWIFADRLEVKEPLWQNAVEGWLNTQRFNILVAEKDFQSALEVYNGLPVKVAGVGLPNLARMHQAEIVQGSLAEVVEADSPLARRYVAYLLGGVMMANINNLKEYEQAITRECMRYSGHTASRIKEEVYSHWYIGKNAKEKRLAQIRQAIWEKEAEVANLEIKIKTESEKEKILRNVYATIFELQEKAIAFTQVERLRNELKAIDTELAAIDTTEFEELQTSIGNVQHQLEELRQETSDLNQKVGEARNALGNLQTRAVQLSQEYENSNQELQTHLSQHAELLQQFEDYYRDRTKNDNSLPGLIQIQTNYDSSMKGLLTKVQNEKAELRKHKHEYNLKHHTYMQEDGEDSEPYITTLNKYRNTELPSYREKIEHARQEAEQQFREHFVSRLNEYLTEAKESFAELNHTLKNIHFGQDQYSFIMEVQTEKKRLLEAIREAAQVNDLSGTLFEQLTSEEQKRSIEGLFASILANDLHSEEVRELCDYRKYFHYDIKIRHTQQIDKQTGKPLESSLAHVLREKSGGETQTPYYVAIAASFYRFYKDEKDAIRLVLFDEAFNKMDDDRIGNTVDFFKKLGMQIVTAVPTEKIETIAPYMDKINLIIRKDYQAYARDYTLLKEKTAADPTMPEPEPESQPTAEIDAQAANDESITVR